MSHEYLYIPVIEEKPKGFIAKAFSKTQHLTTPERTFKGDQCSSLRSGKAGDSFEDAFSLPENLNLKKNQNNYLLKQALTNQSKLGEHTKSSHFDNDRKNIDLKKNISFKLENALENQQKSILTSESNQDSTILSNISHQIKESKQSSPLSKELNQATQQSPSLPKNESKSTLPPSLSTQENISSKSSSPLTPPLTPQLKELKQFVTPPLPPPLPDFKSSDNKISSIKTTQSKISSDSNLSLTEELIQKFKNGNFLKTPKDRNSQSTDVAEFSSEKHHFDITSTMKEQFEKNRHALHGSDESDED